MNKVIIVSGVSGSGKSRYAGSLLEAYVASLGKTADELIALMFTDPTNRIGSATYCNADGFFMSDGVYHFDASKLSLAHGKCFRDFIKGVQNKCELVIVDNTNTTSEEIAPYVLGGQAYDYEVEIHTIMCDGEDDVREAAGRNAHGVPFAGVLAQHRRLQSRKLAPWWTSKTIPFKRSK